MHKIINIKMVNVFNAIQTALLVMAQTLIIVHLVYLCNFYHKTLANTVQLCVKHVLVFTIVLVAKISFFYIKITVYKDVLMDIIKM